MIEAEQSIYGTAVPHLWWVQYFNSSGQMILNTLEITGLPKVAMAAPEDLIDSERRLNDVLAIISWVNIEDFVGNNRNVRDRRITSLKGMLSTSQGAYFQPDPDFESISVVDHWRLVSYHFQGLRKNLWKRA